MIGAKEEIIERSSFAKESWTGIPGWTIDGVAEDTINSIEINGNYLVALFENSNYKGKCEVFTHSDDNLKNNPIGRCNHMPGGILPCPGISIPGVFEWQAPCLGSCVSSFIIIPIVP